MDDGKVYRRLNRHTGPYDKKVHIVRAKKLPMGLYGCAVAPVNEAALRTFRSAIASCLTIATTRRSADFTFVAASLGRDVDPDVGIVNRRVVALRRGMAKCNKQKKMIGDIY